MRLKHYLGSKNPLYRNKPGNNTPGIVSLKDIKPGVMGNPAWLQLPRLNGLKLAFTPNPCDVVHLL